MTDRIGEKWRRKAKADRELPDDLSETNGNKCWTQAIKRRKLEIIERTVTCGKTRMGKNWPSLGLGLEEKVSFKMVTAWYQALEKRWSSRQKGTTEHEQREKERERGDDELDRVVRSDSLPLFVNRKTGRTIVNGRITQKDEQEHIQQRSVKNLPIIWIVEQIGHMIGKDWNQACHWKKRAAKGRWEQLANQNRVLIGDRMRKR